MALAFTQDKRRLRIETPLGKDALLVHEARGQEGLSRLFSYELELISEKANLSFDAIVGKAVTVSIQMDNGDRFINGIVSRFAQSAGRVDFTEYRAELVPWLWFLTRTADSRIFQRKSVPEIVKQIFGEYGFSDYRLDLTGSYEPREYCVQYRETDYNFVARLLEEEGIYFYFAHEKGKHTLVCGDAPSGHRDCPVKAAVRYVHTMDVGTDDDIVEKFEKEQMVRPGKYTLKDYNFEKPSLDLTANTDGKDDRKYEIYDYPGEYRERSEGDRLVKVRQQQEDAPQVVFKGSGQVRSFVAGHRFSMTKHPSFDGQYVLTTVGLRATEETGFMAGEGEAELSYANSFEAIPAATPYRPTRLTPEPRIHGLQTAVVVGPAGEEIFVDKYGRVKVQFFWDREGKRDENSSCWIRVSQNWAGKAWGAIFIPRIGQEVIVEFEEGDPDRPIVTGRVYNAEQVVPYELPAEKTKSTIKSRSSSGGGPSNFNEIRFEDKKGAEQLFMNAEKDMDLRVESESREWVGANRHLVVTGSQLESVGLDSHRTVTGAHAESIGRDYSLQVLGKDHQKVGTVYSLEAGQEIHLKAGMKVIVESALQISLIGPGGFVDIGPAGVTIQGTVVNVNSGGAPGIGTPAIPDPPQLPDVADDGSRTGKLS